MKCSKCDDTLAPRASFCASCGTRAGTSSTISSGECSGCGSPLEPGSSVCGACGKINDAIGIGEKTKLTMNFGGKTKTFNLGDIGNLGFNLNTGDSSKTLNLRALGKATVKASERVTPGSGKKSKVVAIVFALFLWGLPSWIYTYQKDKWKLWLSLGGIATGVVIAVVVHVLWVYPLVLFASWIWAIILAFVRGKEFYSEYGIR